MLVVRRVVGKSMLPTLKPGQTVYAWNSRNFKVGQVVVAFINGIEIVKRISRIENGQVYLEGDNKDPKDGGKSYGPLPETRIEAVVFWPRL